MVHLKGAAHGTAFCVAWIVVCGFLQAETITSSFEPEDFGNPTQNEKLRSIRQLVHTNRLDQARSELAILITENKNLPHPEILLAQLMMSLGREAQAKNVMQAVSGEHPNRLDVHLAFSQMAIAKQRWYEGYVFACQSEQSSSDVPQFWDKKNVQATRQKLKAIKALCCEKRFAWEEAKTTYGSLLTESPSSKDYLAALGRCHFHLKDVDGALNYFRKYREARPKSESAELTIARLFESQQNVDKAQKYYQVAISEKVDGDPVQARLAYAHFLIWNNQPDHASEVLKPILGESQVENEIRYLAALIFRMQQKFDKAQSLLESLATKQANSVSVNNQLALVLIESDSKPDQQRALELAKKNTQAFPKLADVWSTLGWVQYRMGETIQADQTLMIAMQLGVTQGDSARYLAQVKHALGQHEAAQKLVSASKLAPGPAFYRTTTFEPKIGQ